MKENDLPSLFGAIGVPLSRNVARARVEIRPALSGNKFLPLAIPNNVIDKVQVRYYDECRQSPSHAARDQSTSCRLPTRRIPRVSPARAAERCGVCR